MTGKQKCDLLKKIRKEIAEKNNIVYLTSECDFEGNCLGTCPKCDAEIRYLDMEIKRKIQLGEDVFLTGITLNGINLEQLFSENVQDSEDSDIISMGEDIDFDDFSEIEDDESCGSADVMVCGYIEEIDDTDSSVIVDIEDLNLSVRSYNCLKRAGLTTVDQILEKNWDEMCKVRNLGRKSLEEIILKLTELGYDTTNLKEPLYDEY